MTATLWLIPLAGFFGSFHCAAMCGPFTAHQGIVQRGASGLLERLRVQFAYQAGRLTAYLALGILVGSLGQGLLYWGETFAIQKVLMVLLGLGMVGTGLSGLHKLYRRPKESGGSGNSGFLSELGRRFTRGTHGWSRALGGLLREARRLHSPVLRAALVGLCATLLPCGYLYGFALAAAATGNLVQAVVSMTGFWLGTLPALMAVGLLSQPLAGFFVRFRPLTPILLILFGLLAISGKWQFPEFSDPSSPFCHGFLR